MSYVCLVNGFRHKLKTERIKTAAVIFRCNLSSRFVRCNAQVYVQEASNPTRVKVYGPALERPVKTNQPTHLIVDCSQAGPGALTSIALFFPHVTVGRIL